MRDITIRDLSLSDNRDGIVAKRGGRSTIVMGCRRAAPETQKPAKGLEISLNEMPTAVIETLKLEYTG
jgi:hypothetical protein